LLRRVFLAESLLLADVDKEHEEVHDEEENRERNVVPPDLEELVRLRRETRVTQTGEFSPLDVATAFHQRCNCDPLPLPDCDHGSETVPCQVI
jgi:hypothetical protein